MSPEIKEAIIYTLHLLIDGIDPNFELDIEKEGDQWRININTTKADNLIDKDGELIRSIQHLIRVLVHKKHPTDRSHFLIDVNDYRRNREKLILNKIPMLAKKEILMQGNTIILVGLSGYERLQIHNILAEIDGLSTNSVGPKENRKLLLMPTTETGSTGIDKAKIYNLDQIEQFI